MANKGKTQQRLIGGGGKGMPLRRVTVTAEKVTPASPGANQTKVKTNQATRKSGTPQVKSSATDFEIALRKEVSRRIQNLKDNLTKTKTQTPAVKTAAKATADKVSSLLPVSGFRISSRFGVDRGNHRHSGIDLALPTGSQVRVCEDGTVTYAGWSGGYGYRVVVDHGNGKATTYNHLSDIGVEVGQKVTKGAQIARSGSTGNSTGPHLHFEVKINGEYVNPEEYYDFGNGIAVKSDGNGYTSKLTAAQKSRGNGTSGGKVGNSVKNVSHQGVPKVTADALAQAKKLRNTAIFPLAESKMAEMGRNPLFDVVPYYKGRIQRSR